VYVCICVWLCESLGGCVCVCVCIGGCACRCEAHFGAASGQAHKLECDHSGKADICQVNRIVSLCLCHTNPLEECDKSPCDFL
jgi:hypothetical protein